MSPNALTIETGVKIPMIERFHNDSKSRNLRDAYKAMKPGDSFLWSDKNKTLPFTIAKSMGIKIKTRKVSEGGHRIWKQ